MTDQSQTDIADFDTVAASAVVAICDRFLAQVGLRTYTDIGQDLVRREDAEDARVEPKVLGSAIAEIRRCRASHRIVAGEIEALGDALRAGDVAQAWNHLDEALSLAVRSARLETVRPLPPDVAVLAQARAERVVRNSGRL